MVRCRLLQCSCTIRHCVGNTASKRQPTFFTGDTIHLGQGVFLDTSGQAVLMSCHIAVPNSSVQVYPFQRWLSEPTCSHQKKNCRSIVSDSDRGLMNIIFGHYLRSQLFNEQIYCATLIMRYHCIRWSKVCGQKMSFPLCLNENQLCHASTELANLNTAKIFELNGPTSSIIDDMTPLGLLLMHILLRCLMQTPHDQVS